MNENIRDMLLSNCKEDVELAATLIGENKVMFEEKDVIWYYRNTYLRDERWTVFVEYILIHYKEKYSLIHKWYKELEPDEAINGKYSFKGGIGTYVK